MNVLGIFKSKLVVAAIVLLVVGVAVGMGMTGDISFSTTSEKGDFNGWNFKPEFIGPGGQEKINVASSWLSNGESEQITVQGAWAEPAWVTWDVPTWYTYRFYINGALAHESEHIPYVPPSAILPSGQYYPMQAYGYTFFGPLPDRSTLEVRMFVDMKNSIGVHSQKEVGRDGAWIRNGAGSISLVDTTHTSFEEGSRVKLLVKTGYTGGAGWPVKITPPADRPDLPVIDLGTVADFTEKIIEFPVLAGYFKEGGIPGVSNIFKATLYTPLFEYNFVQVFTIDKLANQPGTPKLTLSFSGNVATVGIVAKQTFAPVTAFVVYAYYGAPATMPSSSDTDSWITPSSGQMIAPTATGANYTGTASLTMKNQDGNVVVKVLAIDSGIRYSEPAYLQIVVEDGVIEKGGRDSIVSGLLWTTASVVCAILSLVAAFGAALIMPKGTKGSVRVGIAVVVGIIGAIATYIVASTPELALSMGTDLWACLGMLPLAARRSRSSNDFWDNHVRDVFVREGGEISDDFIGATGSASRAVKRLMDEDYIERVGNKLKWRG
jgi:hypothetical protein